MTEFLRVVMLDSERLVPKCVSGNGWSLSVAPAALSMGKLESEALLDVTAQHAVNPEVNIPRRPWGEMHPLE